MKKVLIIGYLSRPRGSYRLAPLAKYLPEFGWQPIVLTAPVGKKLDSRLRVIETPYRDALSFWKKVLRFDPTEPLSQQVKKLVGITSKKSLIEPILRFLVGLVSYPDPERGWKPFAMKAGNELLQQEDIDAMISCRPITSYIVASKLKERYDIPWIVDFTDPWSQNKDYRYGYLDKLLYRRLELKTLSMADALVTTSHPWAENLRKLHIGKPVYVVTHGFDPEELNSPPAKLTGKFTITYTGIIYSNRMQDPAKLFDALRDLVCDGTINPNDIEVRFYGHKVVWLEREIERYRLSSLVKHYGVVPKDIALEKQRESHLLLVLDWDDPKERGVYTYKIFEYLGARRPILATGGSKGDVVAELLDETKAGIHAPMVEDIKIALKDFYQEYKLKGSVSYKGEEAEINKYSHREMARKFAEILDAL